MVSKSNRLPYLITALTAGLLLILTLTGLSIVSAAPTTVDISLSEKEVDKAQALPGETLAYTIIITNAGSTAGSFVMTDTLPAGLSYVAGSVMVVGNPVGGFASVGASGNVITATGGFGAASSNPKITITYDAIIASGVVSGTTITNQAELSDGTTVTPLIATTDVVSQTGTIIYLPIVFNPAPAPVITIGSLSPDSGSNYNQKWTVSWNSVAPGSSYQVQESIDEDFSTILSTNNVTSLSRLFTHGASTNNQYYYRVRYAEGGGSGWSNTVTIVSSYRDDFTSSASGWNKVREDLDDTENVLSYTQTSKELSYTTDVLKMHTRGRWDYFIASPLKPTPAGDYQLETNVIYDGPGNLNTYGIIIGADWNGEECPTLIAEPGPVELRSADGGDFVLNPYEQEESHYYPGDDGGSREDVFDNCFNRYYRIMLLWYGAGNVYKLAVKRIDRHEAPNNSGKGEAIINFVEVPIDHENKWNSWRVEVRRSTGEFTLFSNNVEVADWTDSTYINDVYWGLWAGTDEYPGSDPLYDYVNVRPLD